MIASATSASCHSKKSSTHGHRDDGEHVLEEEDQAVAEEEAHALQVDGRARHQLAGLVAVVEAEREPHEVRVERAGACRTRPPSAWLARDQAAADHQQRRGRGRARRSAPTKSQSFCWSCGRARSSITAPVSQTSAIAAACEPTASTTETTSEPAVRPQEPEQPGERAGGSGRSPHPANLARRRLAEARELARGRAPRRAREPVAVRARRSSQPLAPDGWGSGIDRRAVELEAARRRTRSSARQAEQPPRSRARRPATISGGRSSSSSQSRQNAQSSCSRGVGVRSPRPDGAAPG